MAAIIVGFSRAIGETMVVTIASGGGDTSLFETSIKESGGTVTSAMAALGLGTDQVAGNDLAFQSLYFLGALLFIITLVMNMLGNLIVRRMQERY
jgi:phosphate transport system permease protein